MKIYADVAQGSEAWHRLRLGIPTASNFHKIVTQKKCLLSAQASGYALRLVSERLLNMTAGESFDGPWLERGKELEPMAVRQYEFTHEVVTVPVGFITTDDGTIGCSPDRLVASEKRIALEIKCPSPHVHLGYLLEGVNDDYRPQVMGQILVAELERADLYSYHPSCPAALVQTFRDEEYLTKLADALKQFNATLHDMHQRALKLGAFQPMSRIGSSGEVKEITDINAAFRIENERRFVKEGFTL